MVNKKIVSVVLLSASLLLGACGANKQEVKQVDLKTTGKTKNKETDNQLSKQNKKDTSQTDSKDDNEVADTFDSTERKSAIQPVTDHLDGSIYERISEIKSHIHALNSFTNGTDSYYNSIKEKLATLGVQVDDASVKGPFGGFNDESGDQLVGKIVASSEYLGADNSYTFILQTKTALIGRDAKDIERRGKNAQKNISAEKSTVPTAGVIYKLEIASDGNTAVLKRVSETSWW